MPSLAQALQELRRIVGDTAVLSDPDELLAYEADGFYVARGVPSAVVFPTDTDQVSACVKTLRRHGIAMVPRGSGTGLAGGCVAFCGEVLISTVRMTRIESIDLANRVAVVQAGVLNLALSEAVAPPEDWKAIPPGANYRFSPDPSSQHAATIGGNAATNAGGVNTLKHGVTTNHVLGMELVLPDGEILRTRCAPLYDGIGPDLPGLLCGSEGTLGIITRLWCRLVPRPVSFRTVYGVFHSTVAACQAVSDVIASGIVPTSMEMMDGAMIKVVEDAFHYGFPTDAQALLLIEIDGIEAALDQQLATVVECCRSNGARNVEHCSDAHRRTQLWSARKRAFGAIGRLHVAYFTQDACVPRSLLPQTLAEIQRIGDRHRLRISNVFHAGDGNVHPIFFFDEADPQQVQAAMRAAADILAYCVRIGGTITGEHGVGVEKLHMMPVMFPPSTIAAFQRIKEVFDPDRQLNDGKLIPSDRLEIRLIHDWDASPATAVASATP